MKKQFITTILSLGFITMSFAQTAEETKIDYNKKILATNALVITIPNNIKDVEPAVTELFKTETKIKGRTEGENHIFEGVVFPAISPDGMNYTYRIEKASKNDERNTKVMLFVASTANEFFSSSQHATEIANAKKVLEGIPMEIEIFAQNDSIKVHNRTLEKMELKGKALEKEATVLQNTLKETQEKIEKNAVSQTEQLSIIETEKAKLEALKANLEALKAKK